MIARRFEVGEVFELAGIKFRVERGEKRNVHGQICDDQRLDWQTPTGWRAVPMAVGFMLTDFFTDNEDVLYPPGDCSSRGGKCIGGEMYMGRSRKAKKHGWRAAAQETAHERRSQPNLFDATDETR